MFLKRGFRVLKFLLSGHQVPRARKLLSHSRELILLLFRLIAQLRELGVGLRAPSREFRFPVREGGLCLA